MSRAVIYQTYGGPEVLELRDVPEPHAAAGEVRIRVTVAGLNPMDGFLAGDAAAAARFGLSLPSGFGYDFAGVVDEVGDGVTDYAVGDRVYGGKMGEAVADHVVIKPSPTTLWHTPDGISDETAGVLPVAGATAVAAVDAIAPTAGDTVLIGGAAGGVGVFAVQLARLAGARVIGTASETTSDFMRDLGAEPVRYGPGLADRVRDLGVTAAIDLFGTETVEAALSLGVPADRISAIAAGAQVPAGVHAVGGFDAGPDALPRITDAIGAGTLTVPIAARFGVEQIRDAVALQMGRHAHGKIVVML